MVFQGHQCDYLTRICEPNEDQLTHLCWVLMWFGALSGLKINLEKSEIFPIRTVENIEELAQAFGGQVRGLSSSYLGLPLRAPFKSVSVWDGGRGKA